MVDIIEQIKAYEIPHTSYIRAIRYMLDDPGNYAEMDPQAVVVMIENLTGVNLQFNPDALSEETKIHNYYTLLYVVQEAIRHNNENKPLGPRQLLTLAETRARDWIRTHKWVFAKPEVEEKIDEFTGKPKMKKGKKRELALEIYKKNRDKDKKEIIELFQKELDMSKSGATTYFYNMRKKFGDN